MATTVCDRPAPLQAARAPRCRPRGGDVRQGARNRRVAPWGTGPNDQLIIVEAVTERPLAELRSAVIRRPEWTLNDIAPMSFSVPADDPTLLDCVVDPATIDAGAGELRLLGYVEAQFWRDGELWWAGPIVAGEPDLASGVVDFECWDLGFYLSRRFMGAAERRDLLNRVGSMNRYGLPGWIRSGVTAVRNTTTKARGVGSAQVSGVGVMTAGFVFPEQTIGQDLTITLTLMVRVPAGTPDGTVIATISAVPEGETAPYRVSAENSVTTTEDTPIGRWVRVKCRTMLRPNRAHQVTVALASHGHGNTYFDDVRALRNDTTGIPAPGGDLIEHGARIADYLRAETRGQGRPFFLPALRGVTGVVEGMGVRHAVHTQIPDVFDQYVNRDDGWDWWINPQNRRLYFAPRRGRDHAEIALSDRSVLAGGWVHDETDKSSDVLVLGDDDGFDRAEGGYVDRSRTGGLCFQYLEPARNDRPLSALDPTARSIWQQRSQPQTTLKPIKVPASWWTDHDLGPGDGFPNHLRCGVLRPSTGGSGFRVQSMVLDRESNLFELT